MPLRPQSEWPAMIEQKGWRRWLYGAYRPRTKEELIKAMNAELDTKLPGTNWGFSQNIRDNVMESLSGIKGDNSVKIFGPDLEKLEDWPTRSRRSSRRCRGSRTWASSTSAARRTSNSASIPKKCEKMGVQAADVSNVIASALGAVPQTTMIEGEKRFDVAVRWPKWRRSSESAILDIPVDIVNNQVVLPQGPNCHAQRWRVSLGITVPGRRHDRHAATTSASRRGGGCAIW